MAAAISACMIVRNETLQLEACLQSIRPHVQEICIVDTGSTDDTPEIARRYADKFEVFTGCNDEYDRILRFDVARNRSFRLATQPNVLWVDGDDELVDGQRLSSLIEMLKIKHQDTPVVVKMKYDYAIDEDGRVLMQQERERLFIGGQFSWTGWCHEVCVPHGPWHMETEQITKLVHHRHGKQDEAGRNLRILRAQYEEEGDKNPRLLFYLGKELRDAGFVDDALEFLTRYVERSTWDDERWEACIIAAETCQIVKRYDDALSWAWKAILLRHDLDQAYFVVGKVCFLRAQKTGDQRWYAKCVHFCDIGFGLPRQAGIFNRPYERDFEIHRFYNVALNKVGRVKDAITSCKEALRIFPDDASFKANLQAYENKLIPKPAVPIEPPRVQSVGQQEIVFFAGQGLEDWNASSVDNVGIGGSETACAKVALGLRKLGHRVRVYAHCGPGFEGVFDGVEYFHYKRFKNIDCDVVISSRRPEAADPANQIRASKRLLWAHDTSLPALNPERAKRYDKVLCLSNWHRTLFLKQYPYLKLSQVQKTRNGIDLARWEHVPSVGGLVMLRHPHRAVFSSSPDRGLEQAILMWPEVRARVPDAQLHVYYGFNNAEALAGNAAAREQIDRLQRLLAAFADRGVVWRGRIPQNELATEFLQAGVWCYPTWFGETSCITAMEAHAGGLRIVTSDLAALKETVGERGILLDPDSETYWPDFQESIVAAMLAPETLGDREALQLYAKENFSWDGVALDFQRMFTP
jgi:glycosyltransferase involved in cell wall biosynthesis